MLADLRPSAAVLGTRHQRRRSKHVLRQPPLAQAATRPDPRLAAEPTPGHSMPLTRAPFTAWPLADLIRYLSILMASNLASVTTEGGARSRAAGARTVESSGRGRNGGPVRPGRSGDAAAIASRRRRGLRSRHFRGSRGEPAHDFASSRVPRDAGLLTSRASPRGCTAVVPEALTVLSNLLSVHADAAPALGHWHGDGHLRTAAPAVETPIADRFCRCGSSVMSPATTGPVDSRPAHRPRRGSARRDFAADRA